jgi:hypothetical protein
MSKLETNTIDTVSGTSTLQVGSTNTTTITLGASGDTINIPSGATINNNGTQTGFGGTMTPAFAATQANTGFTASADSKIAFATEIFDTDNCYDNSTNYRFTPTTAGKYFVFANIAFDADSAYSRHQIKIYKNGSHIARSQLRFVNNEFQNADTNTAINYVVDMNGSSDYLEIYGFLDQNGATQNTAGYGVFGAYRIIT